MVSNGQRQPWRWLARSAAGPLAHLATLLSACDRKENTHLWATACPLDAEKL
jgi:hypothetical protein